MLIEITLYFTEHRYIHIYWQSLSNRVGYHRIKTISLCHIQKKKKKRESRFSMIDHIKQRMITGSIVIHLLEYNLLKYN